jgi:sugar phosphate permease
MRAGDVGDRSTEHADPAFDAVRRQALSRVAWRFLPILTVAYVLNYLDRTSVGFAALTMNRDLGLTASQFGWGAGLPATAFLKSQAIWFFIGMVRVAGLRAS